VEEKGGFIRFLDPGRDLRQMADLLEEAFGDDLTEEGKHSIRELRSLGRLGPLAWMLFLVDPEMYEGVRGLVWDEGGQVVGNVSIYPVAPDRWQISNMAVAPSHRRKGIGRKLMKAALIRICEEGGRWAILQVREDNAAAISLYKSLGFEEIGAIREMELMKPAVPGGARPWSGEIKPFNPSWWSEEYELAEASVPSGLRWLHQLKEADFRPWSTRPLLNRLAYLIQGYKLHHMAAFKDNKMVASAALWQKLFGGTHRLQFLVHPSVRGEVEGALVEAVASPLRKPFRGRAFTRIPVGYKALAEALEQVGFRTKRVLVQMRLDIEKMNKEVLADDE